MNAVALNLVAETTDIVTTVAANPGLVLLDREKFDAWYEKLSAEAPTDADVTTNKGRDVLRSFAAKVRSEKAAIDKARLSLTKEWRDMTTQANAAGKEIEARLDKLASDVRAPLTAWEEAEKARVAECERITAELTAAATVTLADTAATVRERGMAVWNTVLDPDTFGDLLFVAQAAKETTVATLRTALVRLEKEEADRAELEALRAANAERERVEAEKAAAAEVERQRVEAERVAEERRIAAEKAEADRIAAAEHAAEQRARDEAERTAQAERDRVQREHDAAIATERAKATEADRLRQAEADRVAEVERQRAAREAADRAEAQRLADEQAERERNKAHRTRVKTAAKAAIMTCGVSEEAAQKVVLAIIAGEIPNVTLRF